MWNKNFRILWFKFQIDTYNHFGIPFPIPMYIFQELLDCTSDLLTVVSLFVPKNAPTITSPSFSIHTARELIHMTTKLIDSLAQDEPYDLVDISVKNVKVFIKIR